MNMHIFRRIHHAASSGSDVGTYKDFDLDNAIIAQE